MKYFILFILYIILFSSAYIFNSPKDQKAKFQLSPKQISDGWYLEDEGDKTVKIMHPLYGFLKRVSLISTDIPLTNSNVTSIQIIDITALDTSIYRKLFTKNDFFPASGIIGYPIQIGEFNQNNHIDIYGAYKWIQDFSLGRGCLVEINQDSNFILKKIYSDTLIEPLPSTDLNRNGDLEINFRQNKSSHI